MGLRLRQESVPETVSGVLVAGAERLDEAAGLADKQHYGSAIYLIGYSAEMLLKTAALQFDGATPATLISPRIGPVRNWMAKKSPVIAPEGFHNVLFWTAYLRMRRTDRGRKLDRHLDGLPVHHANRIYSGWWIGARYRGDVATESDFRRVLGDVSWIRSNHAFLWRS